MPSKWNVARVTTYKCMGRGWRLRALIGSKDLKSRRKMASDKASIGDGSEPAEVVKPLPNAKAQLGKHRESQYQKLAPARGTFLTMVGMVLLLFLTPPAAIYVWYIHAQKNGSVAEFYHFAMEEGLSGVWSIWPRPTGTAWAIIGIFGGFEALLQLYLPGKEVYGPVSPAGNIPVYKDNGILAYGISLIAYMAAWKLGLFQATLVWDHLGEVFSALNIFSLLLCGFLYIKGRSFPSSSDWGSAGNFVFDFFWGMELYPRIGKNFDIKVFTNCRFGLMAWAVLCLNYALVQVERDGHVADSMAVSVALTLIYVTKFFLWEAGYWCTMDIAHDRAGYYLCWGCLVWVPCIYTSPSMYLVNHPIHLGYVTAALVLAAGTLCIYINYDCDRQRQYFRATHGKGLIWGKKPSKIEATYVTENGETKTSLLLTSGWWGLARHFHYVPEILAAFFWTVPGLFNHALPYFYVVFLTILLFDRATRDDVRCREKYKKFWKKYCDRVPYKIVPGVY
ncbi:sterol reductase [Klebsormidium nitens]|uniref:7-dehydrocholesterol reductase n=1 Tax=Klebsormidium nitens TaxID=105231 RepID=A0A1Y1INN6_KLENI|nr:sterol reductase [Klebsormidium nitens]|eukprot:GAQ89718.1 sterol reductase [Klebsormidium nitens]